MSLWLWAACGRNDSVGACVYHGLAVVVKAVPNHDGDDYHPRRKALPKPDSAALDQGDQGAISECKESMVAQAHRDTQLLNKIRQAPKRIQDGSYGRCSEDGEQIEAARLEAVPWAAYCVKHQAERDDASST
jgi:RNA polymerase-binding transcription factor DksA